MAFLLQDPHGTTAHEKVITEQWRMKRELDGSLVSHDVFGFSGLFLNLQEAGPPTVLVSMLHAISALWRQNASSTFCQPDNDAFDWI